MSALSGLVSQRVGGSAIRNIGVCIGVSRLINPDAIAGIRSFLSQICQ